MRPGAASLRRLHALQSLAQRDQLALLALGIVLVGGLLYLLAWRPLAAAVADLERANMATAAKLDRVERLAAEYRTLATAQPPATAQPRATASASLAQLVDTTAVAHDLRIARFQPTGDSRVQIYLDDVPLEQLLRWLNQLESEHAVVIRELALTPAGAAGRVDAQVGLGRSGV